MSISTALSNALSGLSAASRGAEVISTNVSNALTEGYGRRSLDLASWSLGTTGNGVRVVGVSRHSDRYVISERRLADAALGRDAARTTFFQRVQFSVGLPGDTGSLTARIDAFAASLAEAASRPDSATRLQGAVADAAAIARHLREASDAVQQQRLEADHDIARQVERLNDGLSRIHELNLSIISYSTAGRDVNGMLDERQRVIDSVSEIVPLRTADRARGALALFTTGGAVLLDGPPPDIDFGPVGTITPDMTLASGALSQISINGLVVSASDGGRLAGGTLGAQFQIRDEDGTAAQAGLDALARDLIERFADPAVDPSLNPGDVGLFTDMGTAFAPANEIGLAARISVNVLVDPAAGGAAWRLRDGLATATPGNVGNASLLHALSDALSQTRSPVSGTFSGTARSASGLAAEFVSDLSLRLISVEGDRAFSTARRDSMKAIELRDGVDTDHEMQKLLLIERSYQANAQVVAAVDEMMQTVLGL